MSDVITPGYSTPVQVYGRAPNGQLQAVTTDGSGNLNVTGGVAASVAFSGITSATNTTAAMVVGTGASLAASGSGTITATAAPFSGITGSTNSTAALVIGTGASLTISGSGTINATTLGGATFAAPGAIGGTTPAAGTFTSLSASGLGTFTGAGAASTNSVKFNGTLFTGGSGTTTFPNVYIDPGSNSQPTTWSVNGTLLGLNAPTGFTGKAIDFHLNGGGSLFSIDQTGAIANSGSITGGAGISAAAASLLGLNGRGGLRASADGVYTLANNAGTTGTVAATVFSASTGTASANGNFALSGGWGTTAAATATAGFVQHFRTTITASGTGQAANPTITVTLPNALVSGSTLGTAIMTGGTGTLTMIQQTTVSATAPVFTFNGTPGAGSTYVIDFIFGP